MKDSGKATDDIFLLVMVNMGLAMVGVMVLEISGGGETKILIVQFQPVRIVNLPAARLSRSVYKASSIRSRAKPGFSTNSFKTEV